MVCKGQPSLMGSGYDRLKNMWGKLAICLYVAPYFRPTIASTTYDVQGLEMLHLIKFVSSTGIRKPRSL